jgi:OmpA-OmpF porin, OOP family
MKKLFIIISIIIFFFVYPVVGEDIFRIQYLPGEKYKITEISDFRKRVNNTYVGFIARQTRGIMNVTPGKKGGFTVNGYFYVFEETKHDSRLIANAVDKAVPVEFSITPDGRYIMSGDTYYPTTRNFPVFPDKALAPGDTWRAFGIRYVEPFNDGIFTKVSFYCEYKYEGKKKQKSGTYELITAQYALRYKEGDDPKGDPRLKAIKNGGHKVSIYFDADNSRPVLMRDQIIENLGGEVYEFSDGSIVTIKGITLTIFDMIERMDKEDIIDTIEEDIDKEEIEDVDIVKTDEGVKLTLNNIYFVPDKDIILPQEKSRLDELAETLKNIENRTFLVVGHTAKAGTVEEQYELSVKRAKAVVDYFISKGIPARRFLYEGRGATEPVAPNDTEENMKKNRRVEIIILED